MSKNRGHLTRGLYSSQVNSSFLGANFSKIVAFLDARPGINKQGLFGKQVKREMDDDACVDGRTSFD